MRGTLFGNWEILKYLKKVHISFSNRRPKTNQNARWLVLQLSSEKIKKNYPQLNFSWQIVDYDSPAFIEATLLNGYTHRQLLEGYSSAQRQEIIDKWRFSASLEPWEEVLAPKPPQEAAAAAAAANEAAETQQDASKQQ